MAPLVGDRKVAEAFWRAAKTTGASKMAVVALYCAGVVESRMRNLDHGDRDSLGALQQRAPWGSAESRMNPEESAVRFLNKAKEFEPWKGTPGGLAQKVQVSAFPLRYDAALPLASAWIIAMGGLELIGNVQEGVEDAVPGAGALDALGWFGDFFAKRNGLRRSALVVVGVILTIVGVGLAFGSEITGTAGKAVRVVKKVKG